MKINLINIEFLGEKTEYIIESNTDLRYEDKVVVGERELIDLFEENYIEFMNNGDKDEFIQAIDTLYLFYNNKLTIEDIVKELKTFGYKIWGEN